MFRVVIFFLVLFIYVNGSTTSVGEERASLSAVLPVIMWFLFGSVSSSSGMGYVILLWHSLSLPYNYVVFVLCCQYVIPK